MRGIGEVVGVGRQADAHPCGLEALRAVRGLHDMLIDTVVAAQETERVADLVREYGEQVVATKCS